MMIRAAPAAIAVLVLLGAGPPAPAQSGEPPPGLPSRWVDGLTSGVPRRMVQAAVEIGDAGRADAGPHLAKALAEAHQMDEDAGHLPALALLDALIRVGATTRAADLTPFARGETLPAVLVLASRAPKRHLAVLQEVFDRSGGTASDLPWLVAGALLSQHAGRKTAAGERFARSVLNGARFTVIGQVVTRAVALPGVPRQAFGSTRFGSRVSVRSHPGFARFGYYEIDWIRRKGDIELAKAADIAIFARRRILGAKGRLASRSNALEGDKTPHALRWISCMLGTDVAKLPLRESTRITILYRGPAEYRRDLRRAEAQIQGGVEALIARLRTAGIIRGEAAVRPTTQVAVRVEDFRPATAPPLPVVAGVPVSVRKPLPTGTAPKRRSQPPTQAPTRFSRTPCSS